MVAIHVNTLNEISPFLFRFWYRVHTSLYFICIGSIVSIHTRLSFVLVASHFDTCPQICCFLPNLLAVLKQCYAALLSCQPAITDFLISVSCGSAMLPNLSSFGLITFTYIARGIPRHHRFM
jgi:hypothetical protein